MTDQVTRHPRQLAPMAPAAALSRRRLVPVRIGVAGGEPHLDLARPRRVQRFEYKWHRGRLTPDGMDEATHGSDRKRQTLQNTMGVVIADDRFRSRQGLRALLATQPRIEVVGEASDGWEALSLVEERRPDAVLMDHKMPAMDGLEATRRIKERWPEIKVIMLTMYGADRAEAMTAGADAFLVKGCSAEELLRAILDCEEAES